MTGSEGTQAVDTCTVHELRYHLQSIAVRTQLRAAACAQVGYGKEVLSRGTYAELLEDYRPFTDSEQRYFEESAQFAYESFRDKAAASRGMEPAAMQEYAQGRVWSGQRAVSRKCAP